MSVEIRYGYVVIVMTFHELKSPKISVEGDGVGDFFSRRFEGLGVVYMKTDK